MDAHEEKVLAIRLTLGHYLRTEDGDWVRIASLTLDGDEVVITCCGGRAMARVPATARIAARSAGSGTDPGDEHDLDVRMAGWYPGDAAEVAHAVDEHDHPIAPPPTQRVAYGHPVPAFERDEELVGIYGGDLDHIVDALAAKSSTADVEARRRRQSAFKRGMAGHAQHHGEPPEPEPDDELDERFAGWYAGDIDSIIASQPPRDR